MGGPEGRLDEGEFVFALAWKIESTASCVLSRLFRIFDLDRDCGIVYPVVLSLGHYFMFPTFVAPSWYSMEGRLRHP